MTYKNNVINIILYLTLPILLIISTKSHGLELTTTNTKIQLVELFTSEACAYCPEADKWMNSFSLSSQLWKEVVPVEFHVSYWNSPKLKDPFSKDEFSERQKEYSRKIGSRTFTPQVILNGKVLKKWRRSNKINSEGLSGILKVQFNEKSGEATIVYSAKKSYKYLQCQGALMDGGITSKTSGGKNNEKGRHHEFAVVSFMQKKMTIDDKESKCILPLSIKDINYNAVAFWVSNRKTYEVLQAAGKYINWKCTLAG